MEFKKEFTTQAELEALLAEEFPDEEVTEEEEVDEESEEEVEETEEEIEVVEDTEEEVEEEADDEEEDVEDTSTQSNDKLKKPEKQNKQEYAFQQLRKERDQYKQKATESSEDLETLKQIAIAYGYKDHTELLKKLREAELAKEAKRKGVDPVVYKEIAELKQKISETEKAKEEYAFKVKQTEFLTSLNRFVQDNNLTELETEQILKEVDKEYTVGELLNTKNPLAIVKGYAADVLVNKKLQKTVEKTTKTKKFEEHKFKNTKATEKSLDELVEEDLKKYAKENGIRL